MRILFIVLTLVLSLPSFAEITDVYYYGTNDKPVQETEAIKKIEVEPEADNKIWVNTYLRIKGNWQIAKRERVRIWSPGKQTVGLYSGKLLINKTKRRFTLQEDGIYNFEDKMDGKVVRSGQTKTRIPIQLEGMVTEYYGKGKLKSESMYTDNQLQWNHNWLKNGEKYIDTVFYSVDTWPVYLGGDLELKQHMNNQIIDSKYYDDKISGTVLLGFVILENGELDGVRLLNDAMLRITDVAIKGLETLPAKWEPAKLNNKIVRCFMTYPVNFMQGNDVILDEIEVIGNMMYYRYR